VVHQADGPGRGMTGGRAGDQGEGDGPAEDEGDGQHSQPRGQDVAESAAAAVGAAFRRQRRRGGGALVRPGGGVRVWIRHAVMLQGATA